MSCNDSSSVASSHATLKEGTPAAGVGEPRQIISFHPDDDEEAVIDAAEQADQLLNDEAATADDDVEVLEEPKFKYRRVLNDLSSSIWPKDETTAIAVHEKYLALGTSWGRIYLVDHAGHIIDRKVIPAHSVAVNCIDIDATGEHIASCSNDGKVFIYGLWCSDRTQVVVLDRPIRRVVFDPHFAQHGSNDCFITGDRDLLFHEKNIFGRHKQALIYAGRERDGHIHAITWRNSLVIFGNETGIRVYDRQAKTLITHVTRRHDPSIRSDLYSAHIHWQDDERFMFGWANTFTVCQVKTNMSHSLADAPQRYVETLHLWDLDYYVAGVARSLRYYIILATCRLVRGDSVDFVEDKSSPDSEAAATIMERPHQPRILLLDPLDLQNYETLSEDIIEVRDCARLLCHQYHLSSSGPAEWFVMAPRDLIVMRPCTPDDHVHWLVSNGLFRKALAFTQAYEEDASEWLKRKDSLGLSPAKRAGMEQLKTYSSAVVAKEFIESLFLEEDYAAAAELTPLVCGRRKDTWEEYVTKFERVHQLHHLQPFVPLRDPVLMFTYFRYVTKFERVHQLHHLQPFVPLRDPVLEPECYEYVLRHYMQNDVHTYKKLVLDWPPSVYRLPSIVTETLQCIVQRSQTGLRQNCKESDDLLEALALLYTFEENYEGALKLYMKLGHKALFPLIERYRLFHLVRDKIQDLMAIDRDLTVKLLKNNEDSLPPAMVIEQLHSQPELQLEYLRRLFARGEGTQEFADLAVVLFAKHAPVDLISFLRSCQVYDLDRALAVCRSDSRRLAMELAFLLARTGNRNEALKVIISQTENIDKAIAFCKENDDPDLWKDLISYSLAKHEYVRALMETAGTHIDPSILIQAIPDRMQIPGLRNSLVKILGDHSMQIRMQEGCRRVACADAHGFIERLMARRSRALVIDSAACLAVAQRSEVMAATVRVYRQCGCVTADSNNAPHLCSIQN